MNELVVSAPAKLNLDLRVLGRREDGFHEIDTGMVQLPGLADRLIISEAKEFAFTCDDDSLPLDGSNLVVRAARAFESGFGIRLQLAIHLQKRIPHGAGLAGGSSDAAAVLRGLAIWHSLVGRENELRKLAAEIGSDIPFFITGGAARCQGRGERVTPWVDAPPPLPVLLLKPSFGVSTPDAYRRWKDSTAIPGIDYAPQLLGDLLLLNELERPVFGKHRFLAELKTWLRARPEVRAALMSGSGSTMFAILDNLESAASVIKAAHLEMDPALWTWTGMTGAGTPDRQLADVSDKMRSLEDEHGCGDSYHC